MSRQCRLQFAGAIYHVIARGNNREPLVHDERDVGAFLDSLATTCERYAWRVYGWCLMPNHYHLVLETAKPSLSLGMRRHNSTYAQFFNWRHKRVGHVFQGRYKALVVANDEYFLTLLRYVELNPCRAALVPEPTQWPWSSVHVSLGISPTPRWSAVAEVWKRFGRPQSAAIARYREFLFDGLRQPALPLPIQHALIVGDATDAAAVYERAAPKRTSAEIPKGQRAPLPPLAAVFSGRMDSDAVIQEAYAAGYTLRAIAEYVGAHYATVSTIARRKSPRRRGSTVATRLALRPIEVVFDG